MLDTSHNSSFSPAIAGLQIAWDSTSMGALKECPRKYQYAIVQGLVPRSESVHLTFGLHYHAGLERYDHARAAGESHEDAQIAAVRYVLEATWDRTLARPWASDDPNKNRLTLVRTIVWYLEQFEQDPMRTIVLANGKPAVELSFRFELPYDIPLTSALPYLWCGHLDRMVEFQGHNYVVDRKTTKHTLNPDFFEKYSPDNQFSGYMTAGRIAYNVPLAGLIVDAAQVAVTFSRFLRGPVVRHESQLDEWMEDLGYWIRQAESYAKAGYWPQNDKSCLSGETIVSMTRGAYKGKKVKIKDLWKQFHGINVGSRWNPKLSTELLCDIGGYVGFNKVVDVIKQKEAKPIYILEAGGRSIRATADHKFLTSNGWKELKDITIGDAVRMWRTRRITGIKTKRTVYEQRATISGVKYHPAAFNRAVAGEFYGAQRKARLVVEAQLNNLTLVDFIHILKNDHAKAKQLKYLPNGVEVHHINGNSMDDSLDNLEVCSVQEHHTERHNMKLAVKATEYCEVTKVEATGAVEQVYDIAMLAPFNNFVANGFIAHNCGNYGGCPYRAVCGKAPNARQQWLDRLYVRRVWDPLQVRGDI